MLLGRLLAFQSSVRLRSFCLKVSRRFDKNRRLHLRRPQKGSLPIGFIPLIHFVYILTQSAEKAREISRLRLSAFWIKAGGSMWESNPPKRLLTAITGFEDQRAHQRPSTPILLEAVVIISHLPPFCKRLLVNSLSILLVLFIGFINSLAEIPFWRYTGSSVIPPKGRPPQDGCRKKEVFIHEPFAAIRPLLPLPGNRGPAAELCQGPSRAGPADPHRPDAPRSGNLGH